MFGQTDRLKQPTPFETAEKKSNVTTVMDANCRQCTWCRSGHGSADSVPWSHEEPLLQGSVLLKGGGAIE